MPSTSMATISYSRRISTVRSARLADLGDPIVDPAAELHRGLAGHLADMAWAGLTWADLKVGPDIRMNPYLGM